MIHVHENFDLGLVFEFIVCDESDLLEQFLGVSLSVHLLLLLRKSVKLFSARD